MNPILSNRDSDSDARLGQDGSLEVFAVAMRAEFLQASPPAPALLAELSAAAAEAASTSNPGSATVGQLPAAPPAGNQARPARHLWRPALVGRIALAALSVPLLLTGLAFAGVTLPGPARDVIESIGVQLPNQPDDAGANAAAPAAPGAGGAGNRFANGPTQSGGKGKGRKDTDGRPGNPVGPSATGQSNGVAKGPNPTPGEPRGEGSDGPPPNSNAGGKGK